MAATPTAKLHAAYIPSGKTVDHRRGSYSSRGHRASTSSNTKSHSIVRTQSPRAMSLSAPSPPPRMPNAPAATAIRAAASAAIPSAPPVIQWSPWPNAELPEVEAGDDEHVEDEAERERHERGDQQPARVLLRRERRPEHGERFGGDREQQRRADGRRLPAGQHRSRAAPPTARKRSSAPRSRPTPTRAASAGSRARPWPSGA